jgi:hypothetical protein
MINRVTPKPHNLQKLKMKSDESKVQDDNGDSNEAIDPEDDKPPVCFTNMNYVQCKLYVQLCPHIGNSTALSNLQCRLDNLDQWNDFHALGTEMIITKTGR